MKSHPQAAEERGRRGEKAKSAPPSKNDLSREYAVAVGHISWACSEDDLRQLFLQKCRRIKNIRYPHSTHSGKGKAFATVAFDSSADRKAALTLVKAWLYGRRIEVQEHRPH